MTFISGTFWNSPSEVLKKILVINIFSNSNKKCILFASISKVLEYLWMATSGNSGNKILIFNNNGPPKSDWILFWKNILTKKHLLSYFPLEPNIHICTRFSSQFYHSHHLWLHHCSWPYQSQNSSHKKLQLFILLVQKCMVRSQIFQSQSFLQFLTQCQMKAEICWRTFYQIRWSENWTWFYCL